MSAVMSAPNPSPMRGLLRTMRPRQWVKNLFVLLPVVFAKAALETEKLTYAFGAFVCFCAASSAVYVLNDLFDLEADRLHPKKRLRPIASGEVSVPAARLAFVALSLAALSLAALVAREVVLVVLAYLALNVAYTLKLKRIAYLDVLCIAAGFELRLHAGALAVDVEASTYLVVVTFSLACFLGFGKRMHELREGKQATKQRAVLEHYAEGPLKVLLLLNGVATIVAYVMGTIDSHNLVFFGSSELVYTSVFAAFGILRFMRLVTHHPEAESPTEEMLKDELFLANLALWFIAVLIVVYARR